MNEVKYYRQMFRKKGVPSAEGQCLALRTVLIGQLKQELLQTGMSQQQAAQKLGVKQPRISEILNLSIDKFSAELLVKFLYKLGKEVTVTVETTES
ncbi:MAG: XRE family transcriptional regulator [Candidatus Melainabacteria bacterium]|jgi:predicted XRE-type DNA-binding protein|nr:MAG: XRE family transcriptional regulator [Candidatus Melainabacteria bacterium]